MITAKQLKELLATVDDNALIFVGEVGGTSYSCEELIVKNEWFLEKEDQLLDSFIWEYDFDDEEIEELEKQAVERQAIYLQYNLD